MLARDKIGEAYENLIKKWETNRIQWNGNFSPPEKSQAKTVDLSMASGDQVIAPDDGYSLSEVTVTKPATLIPENIKKDVDIGGVVGTMEGGGGGGGGAGFSMTFPATATNWNTLDICNIAQADGTIIDMSDYSTVAGKTIPNIIEIFSWGQNYNFLRMAVQTGKIMMTYNTQGIAFAYIVVDGESTQTFTGDGSLARWIPLADTVISSIEMYNTD